MANDKQLLIGLCDNLHRHMDKVRLWSSSFRRHAPDGEVVLLVANPGDADRNCFDQTGIRCVAVDIPDIRDQIFHKRFAATADFLSTAEQYEYVIVTDVFDVVFQADPFISLDWDRYQLFVGSEGVEIGQEPWNTDNIGKLFPSDINACRPNDVLNCGVMAGHRRPLIQLFREIYKLCDAAPDTHNIKDQAALNVLYTRGHIDSLEILHHTDEWCFHCAIGGPTQFFDAWGFRPIIEGRYGLSNIRDGVVYSAAGNPYSIVHQFNRIPDWDSAIRRLNDQLYFGHRSYSPVKKTVCPQHKIRSADISEYTGPVIVTALLDLGRAEWSSYGKAMDSYLREFENMLSFDSFIVAFVERGLEERVKNIRRRYDRNLSKTVILPYTISETQVERIFGDRIRQLMASEDFKAKIGFQVPEMTQPNYNIMMYSKIVFIEEASQLVPKAETFVWLDAGGFRDELKHYRGREFPRPQLINQISKDIVFFTHSVADNRYYSLTDNRQFYFMSQIRNIHGTCFAVRRKSITVLRDGFFAVVDRCLLECYLGSDEKVFDAFYYENRDRCSLIQCGWREYNQHW